MNKAIETVLSNKEATTNDYFELINLFTYSSLLLQKDKQATPDMISMGINAFKEVFNGFEFSQDFSDTQYTIHKSAVESVEGRMLDNMDTFHIKTTLVEGSSMDIFIYNTDTNAKNAKCQEIDIFDLKERLNKYKPTLVKIVDSFGMSVTFPASAMSITEECEGDYTFHVTDHQSTFLNIPLKEDSCNGIFFKNDFGSSFVIKPYGQPFAEIQVLVSEADENKPNL